MISEHKKKIKEYFGLDYISDVNTETCEFYLQVLQAEIAMTEFIISEEKRQEVRSS